MASLSAISLEVFEEKVQVPEPRVATQPNIHVERPQEDLGPSKCLFCSFSTQDDTEGLEAIAEHMFAIHGLFIPDRAMLSDLRSFLGYLATQVRVWHECLYCGISRASTQAAQDHMRDSGHCMLNLEREPELAEFWECGSGVDGEVEKLLSRANPREVERTRLSSGNTVISNRMSRSMPPRKRAREMQVALRSTSERPQAHPTQDPRHCHQLARRGELGIQNLGPQQHHALIVAIKRSQKEEAIAMRRKEWTYGRKANDQKHDQAHGPLSWAKGGLHNLLPR